MKTLKIFIVLFLVPAFIFASPSPHNRAIAKRIIKKTAVVILVAHKKVKENKVYTGNLAKAIRHQKFAKRLYRKGEYMRAVHHSRRARILAMMAIKANKGKETDELKYAKEEEEMMKNFPKEEELDKALDVEMKDAPVKDEDVLDSQPDVDINDKE